MQGGSVTWFVNRSREAGCYALDEAFSRKEAEQLRRLLHSRKLECRIQEIPPESAGARASPAWNLLGRLVELEQEDEDRLRFAVVGCLEAT